jgi:tRNA G18 (ribose-2'-O)-methylase SpoU
MSTKKLNNSQVILLENIRSCHNVGAIFRTADAAGWGKVFLCGYTPSPPDRRIEKVSLGAENSIEWETCESIVEVIQKLRTSGFEIIALEKNDQAEDIFKTEIKNKKIALILGNEVEGVSSEILKLANKTLMIPMNGEKESLNVSVAAGIAFYALKHLQN